mmetsp:Transcript_39185/g.70615  ORF Transcript_39185/g.70615 Transcript_39185/m.70615 type:complete len:93 (+) Transcript_39185:2185-2463(+)
MRGAETSVGGGMFCLAKVLAGIASRGITDFHYTGRATNRLWQMVLPFIRPFDCVDWSFLLFNGLVGRNCGKYHGRPLRGDGIHSTRSRDIGS